MDDDSLFDYAAARAARDEGIARAASGATEEWKEGMADCLREIARTMPYYTSDDVWRLAGERGLGDGFSSRRAFGGIVVRAMRQGICEKASLPSRNTERKSMHACPIQVWKSLIYAPANAE